MNKPIKSQQNTPLRGSSGEHQPWREVVWTLKSDVLTELEVPSVDTEHSSESSLKF